MTHIKRINEMFISQKEVDIIKNVVVDADGNYYDGVEINNKIWMTSNLQTTTYNNGKPIPKRDYFGLPMFDSITEFGILYSFNIDKGLLAPKGWHIPSLDEWADMLSFLANNERYNLTPENKHPFKSDIGRSIASNDGWKKCLGRASNGCVGNKTKLNNATGLNIVPCGYAYVNPMTGYTEFKYVKEDAYLWTSTKVEQTNYCRDAYCISITYQNSIVFEQTMNIHNLCGIRCVKD